MTIWPHHARVGVLLPCIKQGVAFRWLSPAFLLPFSCLSLYLRISEKTGQTTVLTLQGVANMADDFIPARRKTHLLRARVFKVTHLAEARGANEKNARQLKWRRWWIGSTTIETAKSELLKNSIYFSRKSRVSAINLRVVCLHKQIPF